MGMGWWKKRGAEDWGRKTFMLAQREATDQKGVTSGIKMVSAMRYYVTSMVWVVGGGQGGQGGGGSLVSKE